MYEIRQQDKNLLLYIVDIKREEVIGIVSSLKGRALLSAGAKPYISVRTEKGQSLLDTLKEIFTR